MLLNNTEDFFFHDGQKKGFWAASVKEGEQFLRKRIK